MSQNKPTQLHQSDRMTVVECPQCKNPIELRHGKSERGMNDEIGRLDRKKQNYTFIVCLARVNDKYCDYAATFTP